MRPPEERNKTEVVLKQTKRFPGKRKRDGRMINGKGAHYTCEKIACWV